MPLMAVEPDTSDIPETGEGWFKRAKLKMPRSREHLRIAAEAETRPLTKDELFVLVGVTAASVGISAALLIAAAVFGWGDP